jgi:ankyrin repeat protein
VTRAAAAGLLACLAALLAGCASPLGRAASDGDVAAIKRLINQGAALDAPDADAQTPLMRAAAAGQAEAITALLDAGADPNASTRGGTPLELAARYDHIEAAKALLAGGAQSTARAHEIAETSGYTELAAVIGAQVAPGPDEPPPAAPAGPPAEPRPGQTFLKNPNH